MALPVRLALSVQGRGAGAGRLGVRREGRTRANAAATGAPIRDPESSFVRRPLGHLDILPAVAR